LKFLQHYCECVSPFRGTANPFFTGDPREFITLNDVKANWTFKLKEAYSLPAGIDILQEPANNQVVSIENDCGSIVESGFANTQIASGNDSTKGVLAKNDIYNSFVDYLENKPFRLFSYEKKGQWYPVNGSVMGWSNRLEAYLWNNTDWAHTKPQLESFTAQLGELIVSNNIQDALNIYSKIKKWGGITKDDSVTADYVINGLKTVYKYVTDGQSVFVKINSTWTKVYALAFPESFVIYDTRVAYAIVSIAEDIYRPSRSEGSSPEDNINQFKKAFNEIGIMPFAARGGTRPRGVRYKNWPNAYESWNAQLQANEFCKGIRDSLNSKKIGGREDWTLREVEAVLFMEGY
jgi:hypothetical protein